MKEVYNGYEEYSKNSKNIRKLIEENMQCVVIESQDITESCKHYSLDGGLHVYVDGDDTYISDESIGISNDGIVGEQNRQVYMKVNGKEVSVIYHPGDGESYKVLQYANRNSEEKDENAEGLDDYAFFPRSFKNKEELLRTLKIQIGIDTDLKGVPLLFEPQYAMPDVKIVWYRMFLLHEAMECVLEKAELETIRGKIANAGVTELVSLAETLRGKAKRVNDLVASMAKAKQFIQKHKQEEEKSK